MLQTIGSVSRVRLTNWIPRVSFLFGEGGWCAGVQVKGIPPCSLNKIHHTAGGSPQLPDIDSGIPRVMEGRGFPWKKGKTVQINNMKWQPKRRSASPFPVTASCSQAASLYISIHELVSRESLWSWWLFFSLCKGKEGVCTQHRVRGRGVVIGVCRLWPPTCNDHLMDVVCLRSTVCQSRAERGRRQAEGPTYCIWNQQESKSLCSFSSCRPLMSGRSGRKDANATLSIKQKHILTTSPTTSTTPNTKQSTPACKVKEDDAWSLKT